MAEGMLTLDQLKKEITAGTIDTVVAAMVDLQGRLVGKRFHAKYFADGGYEETHGCNYLLGVDIEMEPVPGYKATSWEKGYGDFVLKPDLATMRRTPWLPGPPWRRPRPPSHATRPRWRRSRWPSLRECLRSTGWRAPGSTRTRPISS